MKKSLLILLIPALLIAGCNTSPSKKKSKSSSIIESSLTSEESSTSRSTTSGGTSLTSGGSSGGTSKTSGTSGTSGTSSTSTTETPPPVSLQTISQIKAEKKVGERVSFKATYLRDSAWTNEDLMFFADADDMIRLRVPTGSYTGYLANRYHMSEYTVTAKVAETDDGIELVYDSSLTPQQTVVNFPDGTPLSYNSETTPIEVSGIAEIKAKSGQLHLNNKGHASGDLVKFTSQVVQNEYTDANKKTMILDADGNTVTVIGDDKKMVNKEDVGKYYTWIGIISVKTSIPAILGIECKYVSHTAEEESTIDISNATEVSPSYFAKWNLTSSKYNPATNDDYYKLYKATGYVTNNSDITTSYNFGMVDNFGDSLSDAGSTSTVKGFYLVNCTGLDDDDLDYCPFYTYVGVNNPLTVYFSIRSYDTSNHLWKMMAIEAILPMVY